MVKAKPLEWDKHPDEQVWYAKLPEIEGGIFKRGYTILPEQSHFSLYDGFGSVARVLGRYVLVTEAKEAAQAHADQLVADMAQPVTPQEAARIICDASNEFSPLMYRGWTLHDESGGNGTFWYVFSPEWTSLAPYGFDHPEFAMVSGDYQEAKEAVDRRIASLTTPPQKKEE